ncbi:MULTISPECIES: DUF1254 domain-containing protein [Cohaesibacter]|uniref:DUF1254 domain-containing protein n=1 Tax=Cohaesibacter TaxID=655352 RepID=UPI000DEBCF29|nr:MULTISPECIES: hypothetical protein [Cohaesibacter]TLP44832.1 hypothetical protein FDK21_13750 [Cohaesibacter sp. CAU 1516]
MIRVLYVLAAALLTGVLIHIGTIFALPYYSINDIWHRVLTMGPMHRVLVISDPHEAVALSDDLDPTFVYGLCRTDISGAPIAMKGDLQTDFWSLNYLDRYGRSQYSLTNEVSGPNINVILGTKGQYRLLSERRDLIDDTTIVIQANDDKGLLLLRGFVDDEKERARLTEAMRLVSCEPLWETEAGQ